MTTITDLHERLQHLLTDVANHLAKTTGFIQRQRQVTGAGFAQTLVLGGLAQPAATRKQLHQSAVRSHMPVSVQGLDQRFTPTAVTFLRALLETGLSQVIGSVQARTLLPAFNGVYLTDCTRLVWAALGVKLAVRLELQHGTLQARLTELHCHDQKTGVIDQPLPPGALHLGDLGFFKLDRFRAWNAQGVLWLSRYKVGTTLTTLDGQPVDLKTLLHGHIPIVLPVLVGQRRPVRAVLMAGPVPAEALSKRQARLKEQARLDQRPLSQRQIELAGWTIYLTNVPDLTFEQAFILARTRWQIELLFKLWKSHARILVSRSADPVRQQVEGYARLLGVLVAHWLLLVTGWHHDRLSAVDALRIVRTYIPILQRTLARSSRFVALCLDLQAELASAAPLARRRTTPLAFQLWQAFDTPCP